MDTEIDQQEESSFNNSETNGMGHCSIAFVFVLFACFIPCTSEMCTLKAFLKQIM